MNYQPLVESRALPPRLRKRDGSPDARGVLTFAAPLPEPWQSSEDATLASDRELSRGARPATKTERTLLAALGYDLPDEGLKTHVHWTTTGIRQRTWPSLADPNPSTDPNTSTEGSTHA